MKKVFALALSGAILLHTMCGTNSVNAEYLGRKNNNQEGVALSGDASLSGDAALSGDATLSGDASLKDDEQNLELSKDSALEMEDVVLEDWDEVLKFLKLVYSGYDVSISKTMTSEYRLGCNNYSQATLNRNYYNSHKKEINGTCSWVAATSISEWFNRKGYAKIGAFSRDKIFAEWIQVAKKEGAYVKNEYSLNAKVPNAYTAFYKKKNVKLTGERNTSGLMKKINSYNKNNRPVHGNLKAPNGDGHAVVVLATYNVKVKFTNKKNGISKTTDYTFYAICDGWNNATYGDATRVSYVCSDFLTGITVLK